MSITLPEPTISSADARDAFLEYKRAVEDGSDDPNDKVLMKTYRQISRGKNVIDLHEVMREAGLNEDGSPKLAIVRADAKLCWAHWSGPVSERNLAFAPTREELRRWSKAVRRISLPHGYPKHPTRHYQATDGKWYQTKAYGWSGRAVVPTIPPRFRPKHHLRNYHLLWEAEWETVPIDPVLLKHAAGPFYIVLAQWDLTPLEAAMLRQRL